MKFTTDRFENEPEVSTPERNSLTLDAHHGTAPPATLSKWWAVFAGVILLLFIVQILQTAKADSVSWDESQHLYSGWLSWKHADFGYNPEVPPLIKMWCAIPLLPRHLVEPPFVGGDFKKEGFFLGQRFLHANGLESLLIPARMMAALLSAVLAATLFCMALEMFGQTAAVFSLALFCFDPNFLAHGSYVATDIGASLTFLLAIYAFYRVLKRPSPGRILILGVAVGLTFAAKYTGIFVVPMLFLIAGWELWNGRSAQPAATKTIAWRPLLASIVAALLIGYFLLWAIYRFRYTARPAGLALDPVTSQFLQGLAPTGRGILLWLAKHHLFPEAYLYGLADTKISAASIPSYLLGRVTHSASRWYYPAAFTIKSTLPFLILLGITAFAVISRRWKIRREAVVLLVPPAVLFLVASTSDIGIGFRHLMPMFPMLYILMGGCAAYLARMNKRMLYVFGALLLWQVIEPIAARPGLLAYANEAWGGPAKTHLYLSDSNTDWGQQLKYVRKYLDGHKGESCYFSYAEQGPVDFRDYGINCQVLPTGSGSWLGMDSMHFGPDAVVSGLVLVSDSNIAGVDIPGKANPYEQFQTIRPTAVIDRGVYVYQGRFNLGAPAALSHVEAAGKLLESGQTDGALGEARLAVGLDADSALAWKVLGDALAASGQTEEAYNAYDKALQAPSLDPYFGEGLIAEIQKKLEGRQKSSP